jgi:hypothetical protein
LFQCKHKLYIFIVIILFVNQRAKLSKITEREQGFSEKLQEKGGVLLVHPKKSVDKIINSFPKMTGYLYNIRKGLSHPL